MMDGAWNAKTMVSTYLAADLPTRLIRFRNAWGYDDARLPNPEKYIQWEPLTLDHWPTLITLVSGTTGMTRSDWDDAGNPIYEVRYSMRTYIWVKAEGPDLTTEIRDNLTTVVRDALLDHPALRSIDLYADCEPYVAEETIREEFSDLTLVKGERYLAGAYVSYDLKVNETVSRELLSDSLALSYLVTVEQMSKVPNAPTYLLAVSGDGEVDLSWHASTWDGGLYPIAGYRVELSTDGGYTWLTTISDTQSTVPVYTAPGLVNGTEYMFRVSAINEIGVGAASSPSNIAIPATI